MKVPKIYSKESFEKKYKGYHHVNAAVHYEENDKHTFSYIFGSASQILSYANSKGDHFLYIVAK